MLQPWGLNPLWHWSRNLQNKIRTKSNQSSQIRTPCDKWLSPVGQLMTCSQTTDTNYGQTVNSSFPKTAKTHSFMQRPNTDLNSSSKTSFGYGLGHFYVLTWFDGFLVEFVYKMDLAFQWIFRLGGKNWVRWNNQNISKEHVDLKVKHHVSKEDNNDKMKLFNY